MITTLGQFLGSLKPDTFFVAEPEADGTRCYFPIEDLSSIPGNDPIWQSPIVVLWMDAHTVLISYPTRPDPICKLIVSKHKVFAPKPVTRAVYLFPVANVNAIMNMAEMLAGLNESWKRDNCLDARKLVKEGMEYAQLDFDRPQPQGQHWTDDEPQYQRIFAT